MSLQAERALQQEIMIRLRALPVIAIAVPNSIFIPARTLAEKVMAARIINQMKATGGLVPGAPDLCLFWAGGSGLIELKRPKSRDLLRTRQAGRPSASQIEMAERAVQLGVHHAYANSWQDVRDRLGEWGAPIQGAT